MAAVERKTAEEMAKLYNSYAIAKSALDKAEADQVALREKLISLRQEVAAFNAQIKSAVKDWAGEA